MTDIKLTKTIDNGDGTETRRLQSGRIHINLVCNAYCLESFHEAVFEEIKNIMRRDFDKDKPTHWMVDTNSLSTGYIAPFPRNRTDISAEQKKKNNEDYVKYGFVPVTIEYYDEVETINWKPWGKTRIYGFSFQETLPPTV